MSKNQVERIELSSSDEIEDDDLIYFELNGKKNNIRITSEKMKEYKRNVLNKEKLSMDNVLYITASINDANNISKHTASHVSVVGLEQCHKSIQNTSGIKLTDISKSQIKIFIILYRKHYYMLIITPNNAYHMNLYNKSPKTDHINYKTSKIVYSDIAKYLVKKKIINPGDAVHSHLHLQNAKDLIYPSKNYFNGSNCGIQAALFTAEMIKKFNYDQENIVSHDSIKNILDSKQMSQLFNDERKLINHIINCMTNHATKQRNSKESKSSQQKPLIPVKPQPQPQTQPSPTMTLPPMSMTLKNHKKRPQPSPEITTMHPKSYIQQPRQPPLKRRKISKSNEENENIQQQFEKIKAQNINYQKTIQELEKKLNHQQSELTQIKQQKTKEIIVFQQKIDSLKTENKSLTKKKLISDETISELNQKLKILKESQKSLQHKNISLKTKNEKLTTQLDAQLKRKIFIEKSLNEKNATLKKECDALNTKLDSIKTIINTDIAVNVKQLQQNQ